MLNYNHQLQRNAGDMREEIDITSHEAVLYPGLFRTYLRTYGAVHIIAVLFLVFSTLWIGQVINQFFFAIYFVAALTGIAALLLKPWGAYPAMVLAALITFLLAVINMFVHPPMFTEWGVYYIRFLSLLVILIEWFTSLMWLRYGLRKRTIAKRMIQF
jgi:hypothetical protein